jgi:hypothetical protein
MFYRFFWYMLFLGFYVPLQRGSDFYEAVDKKFLLPLQKRVRTAAFLAISKTSASNLRYISFRDEATKWAPFAVVVEPERQAIVVTI